MVELGELSALNRGAVERVKAFMSRRTDHYRPSYGIRSQDFPRQCVFIGSTNADAYLGDETGGRRFWPVKVGRIDLAGLERDREQIWAEAVAAYQAGERWWLDKETEAAAREVQADRRIVDPWEARVMIWALGQTSVTVDDALTSAVGLELGRRNQAAANRVARILRGRGWQRRQRRMGGVPGWRYERPQETLAPTPDEIAAEQLATALDCASLSPVGVSGTGDGKVSNFAPVTSVTSRLQPYATPALSCPHVAGVRADAGQNFAPKEKTGDTGDSPPDWRALDDWRDRHRQAHTSAERQSVVLAWGCAAGGTIDTFSENVRLKLPDNLPPCLASVELRRLARDLCLLS